MKSSDLKVVAIILSIALLFTLVTSNVVSVASIVMLTKGNTASSGSTTTNSNNNNATPVDNNTSGTTAVGGNTSGTTAANGNTTPGATTPSGNTTPGGSNNNTSKGGSTPDKMNYAQLTAYVDKAVAAVKTAKPTIAKSQTTKVIKVENVNQTVVKAIEDVALPGGSKTTDSNRKKGEEVGDFIKPCNLVASDVKSANAVKSGSGYAITINVVDCVNPDKQNSPYGRCMDFMTVDDVVKKGASIKATVEPSAVHLTYNGGVLKIVVDGQGRVTSYFADFHVNVLLDKATFLVFHPTNVVAVLQSTITANINY